MQPKPTKQQSHTHAKNDPNTTTLLPFVKWVGGKRQLLKPITQALPKDLTPYHYIEPFVGAGAVLLHLQPKVATINDLNTELINAYQVIKNNVDELIKDLKKHQNNAEYFYRIRELDRSTEFSNIHPVQRASRFIYLNRCCYNGLYRVNSRGEFNVPFGQYTNPNIVNAERLKAIHHYLKTNDIALHHTDYETILEQAPDNALVYLDPPYHPISTTANFTSYVRGGWQAEDQIRLRKNCDKLDKRGIKFILSNSDSHFIREQYANYRITTVYASRHVNANANARGKISELLIQND